jgi:hypothetical protein
MSNHLPDNPYPLGTLECIKYEHARHKSTAFGSWHDRDTSYQRVSKAFSAYLAKARKKSGDAAL